MWHRCRRVGSSLHMEMLVTKRGRPNLAYTVRGARVLPITQNAPQMRLRMKNHPISIYRHSPPKLCAHTRVHPPLPFSPSLSPLLPLAPSACRRVGCNHTTLSSCGFCDQCFRSHACSVPAHARAQLVEKYGLSKKTPFSSSRFTELELERPSRCTP